MTETGKKVEDTIKTKLADTFVLFMDGWSKGSTHFVAVFACAPDKNEKGNIQEDVLTIVANHSHRIRVFALTWAYQ